MHCYSFSGYIIVIIIITNNYQSPSSFLIIHWSSSSTTTKSKIHWFVCVNYIFKWPYLSCYFLTDYRSIWCVSVFFDGLLKFENRKFLKAKSICSWRHTWVIYIITAIHPCNGYHLIMMLFLSSLLQFLWNQNLTFIFFLLSDVAEIVLNQCVTDNGLPVYHHDYKVTLNYEFLEDVYADWFALSGGSMGSETGSLHSVQLEKSELGFQMIDDETMKEEATKQLERKSSHPLMIMVSQYDSNSLGFTLGADNQSKVVRVKSGYQCTKVVSQERW